MRRISIGVALLLLLPFTSVAQIKWNTRYQEYFDRYKDLAIEQMKKHRIPASITLAQGVLESGAGYSELARKVIIILALSVMVGLVVPLITMMMSAMNVSVPTIMFMTVMRIILSFW